MDATDEVMPDEKGDFDYTETLSLLPPEAVALFEAGVAEIRFVSRNTKLAYRTPARGVPLSRYRIALILT